VLCDLSAIILIEDDFGCSFRIQRVLLAFEIYVIQYLVDYKLAEVVGFEKG
jgi:hypothetical protein